MAFFSKILEKLGFGGAAAAQAGRCRRITGAARDCIPCGPGQVKSSVEEGIWV